LQGQLPKEHPLVEGLPGRKVAVKRLKLSSSVPNRVLRDYTREVEIVCNLRHDNLVRLLAYCNDGDERILVYEHVQKRSLNLYIFGKHLRYK
jgi:serine/threonine protein kinase